MSSIDVVWNVHPHWTMRLHVYVVSSAIAGTTLGCPGQNAQNAFVAEAPTVGKPRIEPVAPLTLRQRNAAEILRLRLEAVEERWALLKKQTEHRHDNCFTTVKRRISQVKKKANRNLALLQQTGATAFVDTREQLENQIESFENLYDEAEALAKKTWNLKF